MEMTLITLQKGITSLMVIPADIENMFEKIYEGKVPDQWLKSIVKTIINMLPITFVYIIYIHLYFSIFNTNINK